jgi:hypothetical protein
VNRTSHNFWQTLRHRGKVIRQRKDLCDRPTKESRQSVWSSLSVIRVVVTGEMELRTIPLEDSQSQEVLRGRCIAQRDVAQTGRYRTPARRANVLPPDAPPHGLIRGQPQCL